MLDETFKATFHAAAKAKENLIEETIAAFYSDAAETWSPGAILIDGGARNGWHSLRMAALASVERVIAVEASPSTHARLKSKIRRLCELEKIDLRHAMLQDDAAVETIEFQISTPHSRRSRLNPVLRGRPGAEFGLPTRVPTTTIDQLAKGSMERVRFIKLDLEGGEFTALRGGRDTLAAAGPVCVFEHGFRSPEMNGYTPRDVFAFLDSVNLKLTNFYGEPLTPQKFHSFWYAWAFPTNAFEEHAARLRRIVAATLEQSTPA